jgi:hypothetical protein
LQDTDVIFPIQVNERKRHQSADAAQGEMVRHLVQDDCLIKRIHEEELPPDEYYDELRVILKKQYPRVRLEFIEHVVAVRAAFDTAASFALSFGIKKFQLAQWRVKLVGELVGRDGRAPNPALCVAIRNWPAVRTLKDLQSFLGTTNYLRPHMGPSYTRVMYPLKPLLGKDAEARGLFPPNDEQLQAIEDLKGLAVENHLLAVPNERAAIEAAEAWMSGQPAAGSPFEGGVDTSKIAMGGVLGQAEFKGGPLRILLYWNLPLTAAQSQWHPFSQEFFGILHFKREVVKHFGRIPMILHTDHGSITRLEYLPLDRIDAKHYRWHAEITQGGTLLLYRP